jgi:hypothetical protein
MPAGVDAEVERIVDQTLADWSPRSTVDAHEGSDLSPTSRRTTGEFDGELSPFSPHTSGSGGASARQLGVVAVSCGWM